MSALRTRGALSLICTAAFLAACGDSTGPTPSGTMNPGDVNTVSGTSVKLAGGSTGAEYLLVGFNGSQSSASKFTASFSASNVIAVSSALADLGLGGGPQLQRLAPAATLGTSAGSRDVGAAFDRMLRIRERKALGSLIPGAQAWYATRSSSSPLLRRSTAAAAPPIGSTMQFNVSLDPCSNAQYVGARIVAVSTKAIIAVDTLNPAGGFVQADYDTIAATFDTLVDQVDEANFGAPSDIDQNGKVILFFTKEVNKLTPANSRGYVGGFFYGRDVFPKLDDPTLNIQGCPTSNVAEMFYLLVPDPLGTVNGNVRSDSMVKQVTIGTTAHEMQHLINTSRRLYVNNAPSFEEVWLDEGLAHVAEELTFYRESGLTPKQDINRNTFNTQVRVNAFNNYESSNFGRFDTYLQSPSAYGPYQPNDSLETRGATWAMLRYLADQSGSADAAVWQKLVANTQLSGLANLANAFKGNASDLAGVVGLIRNWSVSVGTDNLSSNVAASYQMPSWNFRSLYACLLDNTNGCNAPYPLVLNTLPSGGAQSSELVASGSVYYRFAVAAGQEGNVSWSSNASGTDANALKVTVVRTK